MKHVFMKLGICIIVIVISLLSVLPVISMAYVAQTADYGGTILSIWGDGTYIYVGGQTTNKVNKYLAADMSYVTQTVDYGGTINSIWGDGTHIYVGGATTQRVRKYLAADMSYVSQSADYGGEIYSVWGDGTNIYVGGATTNKVNKYLAADLSYITQTVDYGGAIWSIWGDGTNIYAGGGTTNKVNKYLAATMAYVSQTADYGGTIRTVWGDGTNIYAGGHTTNKVNKYLAATMAYVSQTATYGGAVYTIWGDGTNIFAGGATTNKANKYLAADMSYVSQTESYGGAVCSIWGSGTNIYVGGTTTKKVNKYSTVDTPPGASTSAATLVLTTSARLNGSLDQTMDGSSTVTMFWGTTDGGTTPASWDSSATVDSPAQPQGVGAFYKDVTGLLDNTTYYFKARAVNGGGTGWSSTLSFTTELEIPDFYGIIQTSNNGTDATGVITTITGMNMTALIAGGFVNAAADNSEIQNTTSAQIPFMPGYGTNPTIMYNGSVGQNTIVNSLFYTKGVTGGAFTWFPGSTGGTIPDTMTEPANNYEWTLNNALLNTDAGSSKDILYKNNAYSVNVDPLTSGKINAYTNSPNALDFEATNSDVVTIGDNAAFTFNAAGVDQPFNITVWYKPEANASVQGIITKFDNAGAAREWALVMTAGGNVQLWVCQDAAIYLMKQTTATLTDGEWAHISVNYDGSENINGIDMYINAVYQSATANTTAGAYTGMTNTATPVYMGSLASGAGTTSYLDGTLSDVKIYNAELTAAQIANDYALFVTTSNLVARWKLIDGAGNPTDASGNAHNATSNTADWVTTGGKAVAVEISVSGIPSGEYDITASLAGGTLSLTVGASSNTTAFAGSILDTSDNWILCEGDTVLYVESIEYEQGGAKVDLWDYEFNSIFTGDTTGNILTPSFPSAGNNADVSSELILFQPIAEPTAPAFAVGEGPGFFDTSNVTTGNFTTGNVTLDYPLKDLIEDVADAGGVPYQIPSTFIASFCVIVLSMLTSFFLKRYSAQSIFLKTIVNTAAYGVLVALHIYDWWMLIFFFIFEASIWFGAQHRRE